MNILILGSGGREHTFAWKIFGSPLCSQLFVAPGNAGTEKIATNVPLNPMDFQEIDRFINKNNIDVLIVGPEAPLVAGIQDYFASKDVFVLGPSRLGALLEGSKAYAKTFMEERNIPTAAYRVFSKELLEDGKAYIDTLRPPIVLKADGLAAGKGVLILNDIEAAKAELTAMLSGKFGEASSTVVIEEFLSGVEFSIFVITDGKSYKILPAAKDYKRIGEGDTGLNTGGMGAVSPVSFLDQTLMDKVISRIIEPTIQGIQIREIQYTGFIFFGLINVNGDPYVIEYNCRMGDPESEVVFPRLKNDLLDIIKSLMDGTFEEIQIETDPNYATTIMLVSGGYPAAYEKGKVIQNLEQVYDSLVFHAGTKSKGEKVITNGGRVIALTSLAHTQQEAISKSLENAIKINFEGKYYRRDIGFDL